ncbi:MAG TPA: hypothetical protein VK144_02805 [Bacillota bacterium]|nr:hypothetical protein [Bacillota bacterium]
MSKKRFHFPTCQTIYKDGKLSHDIDEIYTNVFKCNLEKKRAQQKKSTHNTKSPLNLHTLEDLKNLVRDVRVKYAKQFEE